MTSQQERDLLCDYVNTGKLMQIATLSPSGEPEVCNVWYDPHFSPDLLRFISRVDRHHSQNIRQRAPVAGSIVAIPLEGLGQVARAVTFTGNAHELPTSGVDVQANQFIGRWPAARNAVDPRRLATGQTTSRLYEIQVDQWVLFDEANYPEEPRRVIPAGHDD